MSLLGSTVRPESCILAMLAALAARAMLSTRDKLVLLGLSLYSTQTVYATRQ